MSQRIPDHTLSMLSSFVADQMGLLFPRERWSDLEKGIEAAAREFGFQDTEECIRWLMSAPLTRPQVEVLAASLTVGESYFFRDPSAFEALETGILPQLLQARRDKDQRLRIWSAGCSTGEEPYSIAILLHRLLPDIKQWNISILATDVNPAAMEKGVAGLYGKWSFRGAPPWFQADYFTENEEGSFRIIDPIREMVTFEYLNLAEDSYPSIFTNTNAMDLIFCRNVLMYFSRETMQSVVEKLQRSLVEDGWLIVGPVENWPEGFEQFQSVRFGATTGYRKRTAESRASQGPELAACESEGQAAPEYESEGQAAPEYESEGQAAPEGAASEEPPQTQPPSGSSGKVAEHAAVPSAEHGAVPSAIEVAAALYRQGLYSQAVAVLTKLSASEPSQVEATAMLIRSHASQGKLSEALRLCDEALAWDKLDAGLHHLRAEILQEQGQVEEARVSLERAIYLDPKLVLAHFALGNLAHRAGKQEKALKHFENAAALLAAYAPEEILPGSEGMTAGRLSEIVRQITAGFMRYKGQ